MTGRPLLIVGKALGTAMGNRQWRTGKAQRTGQTGPSAAGLLQPGSLGEAPNGGSAARLQKKAGKCQRTKRLQKCDPNQGFGRPFAEAVCLGSSRQTQTPFAPPSRENSLRRQTHQVIDNSRQRPKIGQNKPEESSGLNRLGVADEKAAQERSRCSDAGSARPGCGRGRCRPKGRRTVGTKPESPLRSSP